MTKPKRNLVHQESNPSHLPEATIALADYVAHSRNYNAHSEAQITKLRTSLRKFGQVKNIVVWRNMFVAGHGLAQAAAAEGWQTLRANVIPESWNESLVLGYLAADNELARQSDPDQAALAALIDEVAQYDPELMQAIGYDEAEFAALLAEVAPTVAVKDAPPDVSKAEAEKLAEQYSTGLGQVWQLGRHKIACVDSTDESEVRRIVGDLAAKSVWADPPYGINIVATNVSVGGGEAYGIPFGGRKKQAERFGSVGGAKPFGSKAVRGTVGSANLIDVGKYAPVIGDETIETAVKASGLYLQLYPEALQVWWGANYYASALPPSPCWIVWDKENTGNFADAELAWCSSPTAVRIFKHMWNGMVKDSEHGQRRVHPTQKPIELARWTFEKYGKPNDVIVDPFLGSGISVLAAEQLNDGRSVIGFELAHEYIAATIHRWGKMTGLQPERIT